MAELNGDTNPGQLADTLIGTADADLISGFSANDRLIGNGGDDTIFGGTGNDFLGGNDGDDSLDGGSGNDFFEPGSGNDTIIAGGDFELISYQTAGAGIDADLVEGLVRSSEGNDSIVGNISEIWGTNSNDTIIGDGFGNIFRLYAGNDTVNGGGGFDMVSYTDFASAITVTAASSTNAVATVSVGGVTKDLLTAIGRIQGTAGGDSFLGQDLRDSFRGMDGADTLDGGVGTNDQADFAQDIAANGTGGVVVDLAAGTATDGWGNTDVLLRIESVRGAVFGNDTIAGTDAFNRLDGDGGNDSLSGLGGGDELIGGAGNDTFDGGDGGDTVNGGTGNDSIQGGNGSDVLYGDENDDTIEGGSGRDILWGGAGADTLSGGDGDDEFIGGTGADSVVGGAGFDWLNGYQEAEPIGVIRLDLVTGQLSITATQSGVTSTEFFSGIEGGSGTSGNDTLLGDGADNIFIGIGGVDSIDGGAGLDVLWAVSPADPASFHGTQGVFANLGENIHVDQFGNSDAIVSIEGVWGTFRNDTFIGSDVDNRFRGFDGADSIDGGGVGDFDLVDYVRDANYIGISGPVGSSAINANLTGMTANTAGTITDGYGKSDSVVRIEGVRGTAGADTVSSGSGGITFLGMAGADSFSGHATGIDTADYSNDSGFDGNAGVQANLGTTSVDVLGNGSVVLAASSGRDGFGNTDTLLLVDNVVGTSVGDIIVGSDGDNLLRGMGGDDTFSGGAGNDTIEGGDGDDLAVYSAGRNAYTVTSTVGGGLQISFSAPNSQDFVDIVRDVEFFQFSNGTFTAADVLANQNQAPTAVTFSNVVALTENAVTPSGGIKVADIVVTDDGQGTNTLGLSGTDAASFAITGTELFYVGGSPDFETKPSYAVTVTATDTGFGTGASGSRTIAVTNVAETFSPYAPATNAAASLANAILAGVPGITINAGSVTYTGADGQGSFYDGSIAGLGIGAGVLLTSGDGTPPLSNTTTSYGPSLGGAGDADLTAVLSSVFGGTTLSYDANVLSFTFTVNNPAITSISLNAIFATDEYPDFVDNYVDIAGVFVNGVNYAYFDNNPARPLSLLGNNIDFFRNNGTGTIPLEYDGISVPLSIVAPVTQGLNTIKIAVADTRDGAYDSALFISSLSAGTGGGGGIVTPAVYEISGTPTTTEGGTLTFTVSRDTAGTAATVSYTLTGTAAGSDYGVAPTPSGQITFGENELTKTIVLTTVSDGLAEGTESVIVTLTQATNGGLISQTNGTTTASILDGNQAPTAVVLSNTVTMLAENASVPGGPSGGIRVADIGVTDDALGTNALSLTGADAASFAVRDGSLYYVGASPDFETKTSYAVTVVATDASLAASVQQAFTLTVGNVNEAPTAVALSNQVTTLAETASTAARVKVADIAIADDALGTNGLSLSGADAASFEIFDGDLYLRAGTALDAVAKPSYAVAVNVDDPAIGSTPDASTQFSLTIFDVNQAPTAVVLSNTVPTLAENTAVPAGPGGGLQVADIAVTDDALGTNALSLTGADAASFELRGNALYFVGASPDFETKASYGVTVVATDAGLAAGAQQAFTLAVSDVNEAPTVALANALTTLAETANTAARVKVADIAIADDALGTNGLSLSGADAASFEIFDGDLYLRAGTALDAVAKPSYAVAVNVDDPAIGSTPDASTQFSLTISDVNQAPTAVVLSNTVLTLAENTAVPGGPSGGIRVADIAVTDDALGTNGLSLTGADAASFALRSGSLYFVGASPDFETKASYAVTVVATDASLAASVQQAFTLAVSDANEAPGVALDNQVTALSETASTAARVKIADITISDDALGTNGLSLSGADAANFEIFDGDLYLRAGTTLDAAAKPTYAVTVNVDDTTVGTTPDASASLTLTLTDVNQAPTAVLLSNTVTTLAENTAVPAGPSGGIRVADIAVTDDALGTNGLSLTGADAASFAVRGGSLYFVGASPDFETKTSYAVTVVATDVSLPASVQQAFTLAISNVNEAPGVALANQVTTLAETTSTAARVKVADIAVTDDALGANTLGLTGADAASFEIFDGDLYLRAGTALDAVAKPSYAVTVNVDDATVGATPDASTAFALTISDVNQAPTAVVLSNTVPTLAETASTAARVKVADIAVTDDALGANTLGLTGADAASFEIFDGDLYLRAGTALNAVSKPSYAVTVTVDDATVGATPDAATAFALTISDVNQAPTAVLLSNTVTTLAENTAVPAGPSGGIRVADIAVTDDALGVNALSLTGTDAASFAVRGGSLYFVGSSPDFETKASYAVTVVATDASLAASVQQAFTLSISDVYEAPPPVIGSSGSDTLFGLGDAFTLSGGDGDDTYVIDSADDDVVETPTGGIERVYTRFSGTILAPNVENLVLETGVLAATGNAGGNEIAGNASGNVVDGAGGSDTVTGLGGADTLLGGLGLDRLFGGDGDDSVEGGADADQLIGGGGVDTLDGGAGDDWLWGEDGNDSLAGGDGNDQLVGQAGLDTMAGGAGNDSYTLDDAGDVIIEADGQGTDTVFTTIGGQTLGAGVEILVLSGAAVSGSGNGAANQLYGNGLDNTLSGGAGNDTIVGGEGGDSLLGEGDADLLFGEGGNDTLSGGEGIDQLVGGGGNDSILGGNGADLMWGDAGADTLDGSAGADFMGGGAGDDVYVVDDGGDVAGENAGEGTDTVLTGLADYVVGANIEIVTMLAGAVQVFGNETANRIVGNGAANVIVGGAGADTLEGGGGGDWLFGDAGGNVFVGGAGNDTMVGSSDFATDVFRHAGAGDGIDYIYGYDVSQGDVIDLAPAAYDVVDNLDYFSIEVEGVEIVRVFSDLAFGVLIA